MCFFQTKRSTAWFRGCIPLHGQHGHSTADLEQSAAAVQSVWKPLREFLRKAEMVS